MKRLLAGIILLSCALSAYSQEALHGLEESQAPSPQRITVEEAVDLAIRNNLMLEQARIATDISRRKTDLVWNQFLPTLSANSTLMRTNFAAENPGMSIPGFIDIPSTTVPNWNLNLGFSATLYFSFALIEGIRSFELEYRAGLMTLDKAKLQMEQNIRKMYNNILLLDENAALLNENFANAVRQAEIAEASFRAGLAPRLTWLQAQVSVENMRPAVNELDNNIKNLKGNFAILLGLPYDADFELEPISYEASFIPPDLGEFISRSARGKPDIMELQANITHLQSQRKALAIQNRTPFLNFSWGISSLMNDPFNNSWFDRDNWQYKGQPGGSFSVTLGINFNSLFSFTKEGQQLKDMDANLQIQNLRLSQMMRETELEIFTKLNSLEKTRTTAEAQQAAVDLAEQTYNLTEEAYRAGLQDFQAVQNSALALHQAKLELQKQYYTFLNDLIDLEYAIGVPFGTLSPNGTN